MNHFIGYHKTITNLTSNDKGSLIITNKILDNIFESVGKNIYLQELYGDHESNQLAYNLKVQLESYKNHTNDNCLIATIQMIKPNG
jgi:hypothetical protein